MDTVIILIYTYGNCEHFTIEVLSISIAVLNSANNVCLFWQVI